MSQSKLVRNQHDRRRRGRPIIEDALRRRLAAEIQELVGLSDERVLAFTEPGNAHASGYIQLRKNLLALVERLEAEFWSGETVPLVPIQRRGRPRKSASAHIEEAGE